VYVPLSGGTCLGESPSSVARSAWRERAERSDSGPWPPAECPAVSGTEREEKTYVLKCSLTPKGKAEVP